MSQRLRDLIRQVRECKTSAEEREVISKEAALIRTAFSKGSEYRPRNLAKLLYMNMLGYPTHWGQMECVKSIASQFFTDKRIGYLGLNILLDENQEVLMLATHSMKTDLVHVNQYYTGLALTTLGNIASEQICRDCAPEIEQLLSSPNPFIQKKAALCAVKIVRKTPDIADQFKLKVKDLLQEKDHGVLIATAALMNELCKTDESYKIFFRQKSVLPLIRILKSLATAGYAPEYDISNITDPFLQVKILNLLRTLGMGDAETSEKMNEVLAQIATNTDSVRNVGNSILYECVNTIMSIDCETELRGIAINALGKFLQNKDNNIRYVALFTLCKVVDKDTDSVKRHRTIILDCLQDPDISIRRRSLQLIYALVDATDVRVLVKELLKFLEHADPEFRSELTAKLCLLSEKYAPNTKWLCDTVIRILTFSGDHVPEEFRSNFINIVSRGDSVLHLYAVNKVYYALLEEIGQQSLNQVGAWLIGEYGELLVSGVPEEGGSKPTPAEVMALLQKILNSVTSSTKTKKYLLTTLLKLSARLGPSVEHQIKVLIGSYQTSMNLDLQQRACEYSKFWEWDASTRQKILEPLPPLSSKDAIDRPSLPNTPLIVPPPPSSEQPLIGNLLGMPTTTTTATTATGNSAADLLNLIGKSTTITPTTTTTTQPSSVDSIMRLFNTTPVPTTGLNLFTDPSRALVQPFGTIPLQTPNLFGTATTATPVVMGPPPVMLGTTTPLGMTTPSVGLGGVPIGLGTPIALGTPVVGLGTPLGLPGTPGVFGLGVPTPSQVAPGHGVATPQASTGVVGQPTTAIPSDPAFPPFVAFQSTELTITLFFKKPNPSNLQYTLITAQYSNNTSFTMEDLVVQTAPPKHVKYLVEPQQSRSVPPFGTTTQVIKASNSLQGQKPLMMKLRITYNVNGQAREIEHVCKEFPSGL